MGNLKNRLIILIILVLIVLGIFCWWRLKERKVKMERKEEITQKELPEIFNLLAEVSEINLNENYLIIKPLQGEWSKSQIKAVLEEETKIIKLTFPFDPKNPPKEGSFTLKEEPIKIEDLRVGNRILIFVTKNIAGKPEFDDINKIQVMP